MSLFTKTFTAAVLGAALVLMPAGLASGQADAGFNGDRKASPVKRGSPNPDGPVVGERLVYDVSWSNFVVAGELTLETPSRRVYYGVDAFHVRASAQSVGVVHAFIYKVNDVYDSYLDAATLRPFRAEKRSRHGKKRAEASIILDQHKKTARLADGRTIKIPEGTYDLASLFHAVRSMNLAVGTQSTFTLLEDDRLYPVKFEVEGREKLKTRVGEFEVVRISTQTVREGEPRDPYNFRFYVTTDSRRLPVLMTAQPTWGEVRIELTSATGTSGNKKK